MDRRQQFAGSYLELFTSSMLFFIALTFLLAWLTFFSPYGLFENTERLEIMNFVLITLFALGPVMAILAGIAFDTLPLVYKVPSFERTTMRHFLQLNGLGQLFIHIGIFINKTCLVLYLYCKCIFLHIVQWCVVLYVFVLQVYIFSHCSIILAYS